MRRTCAALLAVFAIGLVAGLGQASAAPRCQATDLDASTTTPSITSPDPEPDPGGLPTPLDNIVSNDKVDRIAVVQLRNTSGQACSISGHPSLAMLKRGNSLPTRTRRVGSPNSKTIVPPKGTATILIGHHGTPTGNGTRCNTSTNLLVALPGMGHFNVPATISACNDGLLYTSRVLPGSLSIVEGDRGPQDDFGFGNAGDYNSGSTNTGNFNTGDTNTGAYRTLGKNVGG
jgi:hypothetical protein